MSGRLLAVVAVAALCLAAFVGTRTLVANHDQVRALCEATNRTNRVIRDIVTRSETSQDYDLSKLSPEARRILAEVAAARAPAADPDSFHSFVFARTPIRKCS